MGYQAVGTLGRMLTDGAKRVKLFGEEIAVQAEVRELPGISGHGDVKELLRWIRSFSPAPKKVFVNHGEDAVASGLAARLSEEFGIPATAPYSGEIYDLLTGEQLRAVAPVPVKDKTPDGSALQAPKPDRKSVYGKLLLALERLTSLIRAGSGRANRDVETMTRKINDLCNEWEN